MSAPSADSTALRWWPVNAKPFYRPTLVAAIAAAVGIMIGSLSPWVSAFVFAINGLDTGFWGVLTLTLGAVSTLVLLTVLFWGSTPLDPRWAVPLVWSIPVAAAASLATGLVILIRVLTAPKADIFGVPVGPGVGWGLWLLTLSAAVLCVTASIAAQYAGRAADLAAPIGRTSNSKAWRLGALIVSALVFIAISVALVSNWSPSAVDESRSESPSFPNYPSMTDFPSFPTATEADETTTSPAASPTTPVIGSPCDSSQYNTTSTSYSGFALRCLQDTFGGYRWVRDTGSP